MKRAHLSRRRLGDGRIALLIVQSQVAAAFRDLLQSVLQARGIESFGVRRRRREGGSERLDLNVANKQGFKQSSRSASNKRTRLDSAGLLKLLGLCKSLIPLSCPGDLRAGVLPANKGSLSKESRKAATR